MITGAVLTFACRCESAIPLVRGTGGSLVRDVTGDRCGVIARVLKWIASLRRPFSPGASSDPYAWKPAPVRKPPKGRQGSVAVAEPDE